MVNGKRKGKAGELEVVRLCKAEGYDAHRTAQICGNSEEGTAELTKCRDSRTGKMGNAEQWMLLALAVLKRAEADYKISTIRLRKSKCYTADNIAKLHQKFTTPIMGLLCPMGIEETLALWDKKYGDAPIDPKKAPATRPKDGIIFPLELTEENMPKETKKRKPYHEHHYISKIDTGRKTLIEVLEEKDVAQKELAFKVGLKIMKFRACLYGHNAWPRSIVDKICKILEIKFEDVKWERINEGK